MNQAMEILNQKRMIRTKILRKNMAEAEPKAEAEAVEVAEAEAMSNAVAKALVKAWDVLTTKKFMIIHTFLIKVIIRWYYHAYFAHEWACSRSFLYYQAFTGCAELFSKINSWIFCWECTSCLQICKLWTPLWFQWSHADHDIFLRVFQSRWANFKTTCRDKTSHC